MSDLERILKLASHGTDKAQGQAPAERELKDTVATEDEARPYQGTAEPRLTHRGEKYYDHPSTKNVSTEVPGSKAKDYSGRSGNWGHGVNPDAGDPYADPNYVEPGSKAKDYSGRDGNYGHGVNPDAGDPHAEPVFRDAIMRIADKMARQKNIDALSKNYDDRIQRMSRVESVEEAVGEFAEPIYDLIDMHFEGDCQPVFDDLVRFLSGDQIKEFVDDFRRHHELPMGDEETDESVEPTEPSTEEGNEFSGALAKAKKDGKDEFEVDGKKYKVEEAEAEAEAEAEETEELEEVAVAEDDKEELEESPTMDTTQLITLLKNAGLSEEKIKTKLDEWANTPDGAAEEEATSHGEPYENFAQSVNLSLKRYLDAEDMKVGLKEHKVEDIKEAYKKSKEK